MINIITIIINIFIKIQSFNIINSTITPQIILINNTFITINYFYLITLLYQLPKSTKTLNPIITINKLKFTIYITQNIILFFTFYILKLYNTITINQIYLLIINIIILQIITYNIYIKFYKIKPLK